MLLLSKYDVATVLDMPSAIEATRAAFGMLASHRVSMPRRIATSIPEHDATHLSMPCYLQGLPNRLVVKVVTVFPNNHERGEPTIQGQLLVHDPDSGRVVCMMDAELLTAVRTGAASALATEYLARRDAHVVTVFGSGAQAWQQLAGVAQVRRVERAFVVSRSAERGRKFADDATEQFHFPVAFTPDGESAVTFADIICTATNSLEPLFDGSSIKPGTHINAIGSFRQEMRELDSLTICASRVFVDHKESAMRGAGDLMTPVLNGEFDWSLLSGELGDLVMGRNAGRMSEKEVTVFKSVGLAIQDAVVGGLVYDRAVELGLGQTVEW